MKGGRRVADSMTSTTEAVFTFVGEALLIPWLLWKAIRGFSANTVDPVDRESGVVQPAVVPS
jgi:hypothetical protein